jgi:hypothetical protein
MPTLNVEIEILQTIAQLCHAVEEKLEQWLNVRTPEGFSTMEEAAHVLGRCLADGLTAAIVRQRLQDPELTSEAVSRAQQTGQYKPNGRRRAKLTLLGGSTIEVQTAYMPPVGKVRSKGRVGIWPVLAELGIWWRTTPALCSEVNRQVSDSNSFRDALATLQRRGIDLEYKRALSLVQRFGGRAVDQRHGWLEHIVDRIGPHPSCIGSVAVTCLVSREQWSDCAQRKLVTTACSAGSCVPKAKACSGAFDRCAGEDLETCMDGVWRKVKCSALGLGKCRMDKIAARCGDPSTTP